MVTYARDRQTVNDNPESRDFKQVEVVNGNIERIGEIDRPVRARLFGVVAPYGVTPTAAGAGTAIELLVAPEGILYVMGGSPDTTTLHWRFNALQTNAILYAIPAGYRMVVTEAEILMDSDTTVNVAARVGFGQTALSTLTTNSLTGAEGTVVTHPDIRPGSGVVRGVGAGIIQKSKDGDDLLITCEPSTSGFLDVLVTFYLTPSKP